MPINKAALMKYLQTGQYTLDELAELTESPRSSIHRKLKELESYDKLDIDRRRSPWIYHLKDGTDLDLEALIKPALPEQKFVHEKIQGMWKDTSNKLKNGQRVEPTKMIFFALLAGPKVIGLQTYHERANKLIQAYFAQHGEVFNLFRLLQGINDMPFKDRNLTYHGIVLDEDQQLQLLWAWDQACKYYLQTENP